MKIDPSDIELENLSKSFEYHKLSSEVDNCNDIDYLKNLTKAYRVNKESDGETDQSQNWWRRVQLF